MDPHVTLRDALDTLASLAEERDAGTRLELARDAAERFVALAAWLEKGGYPPRVQTVGDHGTVFVLVPKVPR